MKTIHPITLCCLPLLLGASALWAQTTPNATPANAEAPIQAETLQAPEEVGDATRRLLAQQRQGLNASAVDRSIDGPIAARSHARYLKSFEHPQPEWFGSRLSDAK